MITRTQFNYRIDDLEYSILSCLLIKPELMKELMLEDKHFIKTQRMWQFMKSFYKKFETFDINLMYSICKDKYQIIDNIALLLEFEPAPSLFNEYQKQLIKLHEETKKEKWIISKIYQLANDLYMRNITIKEFEEELKQLDENAKKIFNKEVK